MNTIISTGKMIKTYLESNDKSIIDLVNASGVSTNTIYRIINSEKKLSYKVAEGIHKIIPEITIDFLMTYDAKYQVQIKEQEKDLGIKNINKFIEKFQLKRLYPELSDDKSALIEKGRKIFDFENDINCLTLFQNINYSEAKNPRDFEKRLWITAAYNECQTDLSFNRNKFISMFDNLKSFCGTTNVDMTIFNMKELCEGCGINFVNRKSIRNSRIKAATFEYDGKIYIFLSDLFKCVEGLWVSFVHELIHIKNEDYNNVSLELDEIKKENERKVDKETVSFFIKNGYDNIKECNVETVLKIAQDNSIPKGIAAYLIRNKLHDYKKTSVNELIHYF